MPHIDDHNEYNQHYYCPNSSYKETRINEYRINNLKKLVVFNHEWYISF